MSRSDYMIFWEREITELEGGGVAEGVEERGGGIWGVEVSPN